MTETLPGGSLSADLLVIGGGMGGMTVAGFASQQGASVVVVEAASHVGGSAVMSGGKVWTARTVEEFVAEDPQGDVARFQAMRSELHEALQWVAELGVEVGPSIPGGMGFGEGREIDITHYVEVCRRLVAHRGWVLLDSLPTSLIVEDGRVRGAVVEHRHTGDVAEVRAQATFLATGGFQASPELRDRYLFSGAGAMTLRGNPESSGGGLRLGLDAGGSLTERMTGFYGHLLPYAIADLDGARDFRMLAQLHSDEGVILSQEGVRFFDESLGDHIANQEVARRGRALLLIDERVRVERVLARHGIDTLAEAGRRGANYCRGSLHEVAAAAGTWGYPADAVFDAVTEFNDTVVSAPDSLEPPRRWRRRPLSEPPLVALEVCPGITFTHGGLQVDVDGRVLDENGSHVAGLFAAGIDAAGVNVRGYTGGLARGLVLGVRAARNALTEVLR